MSLSRQKRRIGVTHIVRLASYFHVTTYHNRSPTRRRLLPSLARTSAGGRLVFMAAHRRRMVLFPCRRMGWGTTSKSSRQKRNHGRRRMLFRHDVSLESLQEKIHAAYLAGSSTILKERLGGESNACGGVTRVRPCRHHGDYFYNSTHLSTKACRIL